MNVNTPPAYVPSIDPQDYARTAKIASLAQDFADAAFDGFVDSGLQEELRAGWTSDETAEAEIYSCCIRESSGRDDAAKARGGMAAIALSNMFIVLAERVCKTYVQNFIPAGMRNTETLDYLKKYKIDAMAAVVQKHLP